MITFSTFNAKSFVRIRRIASLVAMAVTTMSLPARLTSDSRGILFYDTLDQFKRRDVVRDQRQHEAGAERDQLPRARRHPEVHRSHIRVEDRLSLGNHCRRDGPTDTVTAGP